MSMKMNKASDHAAVENVVESAAVTFDLARIGPEHGGIIEELRARVGDFVERYGRRPRILVAGLEQDGDRRDDEFRAAASVYADLGFDVDIGPLFQGPEAIAKMAVENDAHGVLAFGPAGVGGNAPLLTLIRDLAAQGAGDILVFAALDEDISPEARERLLHIGCVPLAAPDTPPLRAAAELLTLLESRAE